MLHLFAAHAACGSVSDTIRTDRSYQFFRLASFDNPWISRVNPAGLSIADFVSVNRAELIYGFTDKDIMPAQTPGVINSYRARTEGYRRIGNISFYGEFGYHNEHYDRLKYNNTLVFDPSNPYLLGDTIGGRQRKEGYSLEGAASVMLSDRISAGLNIYYLNSTGAKQKDPRNLNSISRLIVTPGVTYRAGNMTFGLSGGPERYNNDVSVSVTENAKYHLFQFMGLGYFKSIRNIYSYSNAYFGSGFRANVQIGADRGRFSSFTNIGIRSYKEEVRYGTSKRLLDAISNSTTINANSVQKFKGKKANHYLESEFRVDLIVGTEINQDFVRIVQGLYSYDSLVTLSWVDNRHTIENFSGRMQYRFILPDESGKPDIEAVAGIAGDYYASNHYPVENWGFFNVISVTGNAGLTKSIRTRGRLVMIPEILFAYRMNIFKDMEYNIVSQSLPNVALMDYRALNHNFMRGDITLTALMNTGARTITGYYFKGNFNLSQQVGSDETEGRNINLEISLGIIF